MKPNWGLILICAVIALAAFGGARNARPLSRNGSSTIPSTSERQMSLTQIQSSLNKTEREVTKLQKELATEQEKKNSSIYKGKVTISVRPSTKASTEYVDIYVASSVTEPINITGWKLVSTSTNQSVTIPKSTSLYFQRQINSEEDVILRGGEHAYIITGRSPIGHGFKVNKCSGYLSQYTSFYPSLYTSCPAPENEDLSGIPNRVINDKCFDLINSLPSCRIPKPLPNDYSVECKEFLVEKINYPYCINAHKNDKDFWQKKWYVYLKRSSPLWKTRRETVILYDSLGKPVAQVIRR